MDKRRFFDFDLTFLTELTSDPQSLVSVHHSDYHFALHPWHLNNFNQSVKGIMYEKISQYMPNLDGILLGYKNLKLKSEVGKIHADSYFIHYDVEADFFVFKPEIDECLNGTVIKKSKDHISCKVYNCFTISIPQANDEMWIGSDVDIGDIVKMQIEYIDYEVPLIKASILNKVQCASNVNRIPNFEDTKGDGISSITKKKSKKNKNITVIRNEDDDTEAGDSESTVLFNTFNSTKKQKVKQKNKPKQNIHVKTQHFVESLSPSDDVTGCVENELNSSVFLTTIRQPKIQISSSENESVSPRKHVNYKKKDKKEQLSSSVNDEYETNNSFNILKIKTENDLDFKEKKRKVKDTSLDVTNNAYKDLDLKVKKRKVKDTSLDETNSESPHAARPKKKKKRSSMSLEAIKDSLLDSILKEKIQEISTDYSNVQLKHEEIMLPDLDMKDILESISSKNNVTQNSGASFENGSFEMSDSSLDRLLDSPVKREPGARQRKSKISNSPMKPEPGVTPRKSIIPNSPVKPEPGVTPRKSKISNSPVKPEPGVTPRKSKISNSPVKHELGVSQRKIKILKSEVISQDYCENNAPIIKKEKA